MASELTSAVPLDEEGWPVAAVSECQICGIPAVLKACFVLTAGSTREVYGYFPGCRAPKSCEREAKRRDVKRFEARRDSDGNVVRIRVSSKP